MVVPQKVKMKVTNDPGVPYLGVYPRELKSDTQADVYTHHYSSIIYISQKRGSNSNHFHSLKDEQIKGVTYMQWNIAQS